MTLRILQVAFIAVAMAFGAGATFAASAGPPDVPAPSGDSPHFVTGFVLQQTCQANSRAGAGQDCLPYIMGVYDAHVAEMDAFDVPALFCPPKDVITRQVRGAVQRYLESLAPQDLAKPAAVLVLSALRKEYPCR